MDSGDALVQADNNERPYVELYGEEINDEEQIEFEEALRTFIDQPRVEHNVIPESDSDESSEEEDQATGDSTQHGRGYANFRVGQIFFDRFAIRENVINHALDSGRNISQYRYDRTKMGFKCVGGNCNWRVYCAIRSHGDKWEVRYFNGNHSCVPNGECEILKVPEIARLFVNKIREEPDYFMPRKIEEIIRKDWKINVSRPQCQAARNKAIRWIENSYDEQFKRLRDYASEILHSNPGSTVEVETVPNDEGLDLFNRFYVCYEAIRKSWKENCRPLIGVDGCFLRTKMKGQLLVALGRDGDNKIYPIAWGVVQVENTANWIWFVRKIKADFDLEDGLGYVMISDRQKGLIRAVELELPKIEHRMCVRHIYANLKQKFGRKPEMKPLIWNMAWSYNEADFNVNLAKLMGFDSAVYDHVVRSKPQTWCRAFYQIGSCCEDVENNSTESFNATIVQAREKPLVPMLEMIARLAMVRISTRSVIACEHAGACTPYVQELLALEFDAAAEGTVFRSTNMMFQVQLGGCSFRVSLESRTCSCRKWEIRGIPCEHAYGVIMNKRLEVEDFVSHWYRTSIWRRTYAEGLTPSRGARFWPVGTGPSVYKPPSPPQPGRKKKAKKQKRKKGVNESPTKKVSKLQKRTMHCRICGTANHNSRWHTKNKQPTLTQGQPSLSQEPSLTQESSLMSVSEV